MKKRFLSLLLLLALALSLATAAFAGAETAQLSSQKLCFNGADRSDVEKYNIDGSNFFKLRDLAALLDGTVARFDVGYDSASQTVSITTGADYTFVGGELEFSGDHSATAAVSAQTVTVDGKAAAGLTVYNIGGSNFFRLRELGELLGFADAIGYDDAARTVTLDVETTVKLVAEETTTVRNADGSGSTTRVSYEYDDRGNCTREAYDYDGEVTSVYLKSYDEAGNQTREERWSNGALLYTEDYRYDADGNEIYCLYVNGGVRRETTHVFTDGLLTSLCIDRGGDLDRSDYFYDTDGNRIRAESYDTDGLVETDSYTYDAAGRVLTHRYESADGGYVTDTVYTYDARGLCLSEVWTADGHSVATTYRYDAEGREVYKKVDSDYEGTRDVVYESSYDAYGNLCRLVETAGDRRYIDTYTYNAENRLVAETHDTNEYHNAFTYEYTAGGLLAKETCTDTNPDYSGYVTVYSYDADGDLTGYVQTLDDGSVTTYEQVWTVRTVRAQK